MPFGKEEVYFPQMKNFSVPLGALLWKSKQVHAVVYSYACYIVVIYKITRVLFDSILVDYLLYNGYM